jgi:hypothetical protein
MCSSIIIQHVEFKVFFPPQNLVIFVHSFHKNPYHEYDWISFGDEGMKIFPKKSFLQVQLDFFWSPSSEIFHL